MFITQNESQNDSQLDPFLELSALPNDMLLLGTTRITYNPSTKVIGPALIGRKKMLLEALEVSFISTLICYITSCSCCADRCLLSPPLGHG